MRQAICFLAITALLPLLTLHVSSYVFANTNSNILITAVSFGSTPDWVELLVVNAGDFSNVGVFEGGTSMVRRLPPLPYQSGDRVIIHFAGDPANDDTALLGKGPNNAWDLYTFDAGLTATDNILRLQDADQADVNAINVFDAVIWSNANDSFTSSIDVANKIVAAGHWNPADFSLGDVGAWIDSDLISNSQFLTRGTFFTDANSSTDWSIGPVATPTVAPTITSTNTPTPSPTLVTSPTLEPTSTGVVSPTATATPTPTISIKLTDIPERIAILEPFGFGIEVHGLPLGVYSLKFEASFDGARWYDGVTYSTDGDDLAWNAPWGKFPAVNVGPDIFEYEGFSAGVDGDEAGVYHLRVKLRYQENEAIYYSDISEVQVLNQSEEPDDSPTTDPTATPTPTSTNSAIEDHDQEPELLTITEVRVKTVGERVKLEGVVSVDPEVLGVRTIYIQDEDSGIRVVLDVKDRDDIHYSNYLQVKGILTQAFDELYIKVQAHGDVTVLSNNGNIQSNEVKTGDVKENVEGQLIVVIGQISATSGNTFYLDDGTGPVKIYIKESAGVNKPKMKKGEYAKVIGIVGQYKEEYRVMPRFNDDIAVSEDPITNSEVLGVDTENNEENYVELPRTGYQVNDWLGLILLCVGIVLHRFTR
jgi:DNA/RNA endonuclease YhcR with UshA esterase domain